MFWPWVAGYPNGVLASSVTLLSLSAKTAS